MILRNMSMTRLGFFSKYFCLLTVIHFFQTNSQGLSRYFFHKRNLLHCILSEEKDIIMVGMSSASSIVMRFDIYHVHGVSANLQGCGEWKVSFVQLTKPDAQQSTWLQLPSNSIYLTMERWRTKGHCASEADKHPTLGIGVPRLCVDVCVCDSVT